MTRPLLTLALLLLPLSASADLEEPLANWHKMEDREMERTIDGNLFVGAGPEVRSFSVEAVIEAPVDAVYAAWTDPLAFVAAYGPDNRELAANIDLAIGGRYEWLWDGRTGSNGCQVLSFIPNRMITFSWNAPLDQPESRAHLTWVVVELTPRDDGATEITLTHLGFGPEEHWTVTLDYFTRAWPYVLDQFRKHLEPSAGR